MDALTLDPDGWNAVGEALLPDAITLRRAIHAEPELGLDLPKTTAKVKAALAGLPLEIREGPSTSGVVAILRGPANGRTVLLRGDMDALPLTEDTGLPFTSLNEGAMHACGHDTHVAMLAGAARALCDRRDRLSGTVMFMFQPGEEGWHGARFMLEDGLIDPIPDAAFALHISPNMPRGTIASRTGAMLASSDKIRIKIVGKGGHASMPQDAIDPIPVACEIVMALQAFATRRIAVADPAVITIARMEAGTTDNIIPEVARLWGTCRTLSERTRAVALEGIEKVARHIAEAHGATAVVNIDRGFPVTVNDGRVVDLTEKVATRLFGDEGWHRMAHPLMGAEDFSYILQKAPGAMAMLGAAPEGGDYRTCCALHSNRMVLDETVMSRGIAMHCAMAEAMLNGEQLSCSGLGLLPASTNDQYQGSRLACWFLAGAALLTIGPALVHSFLPDGGAVSIAGLSLGASREVVIGVFRWQGATQLAWGLAMLAVALRYRPLTPLFLALLTLERGLMALQGWWLSPPSNGHHPPEHYGSLAVVPLALIFLTLSLRPRRNASA